MPSCRPRWRAGLKPLATPPSTWQIAAWHPHPTNLIRDHAARAGAVIVTKDEDFAVRQLLSGGPSLVWLRLGNTRRAALLNRFEADLPAIVAAFDRGETLVEIA